MEEPRDACLIPTQPPLTPSMYNEPSPLDVLRKEVATLRNALAKAQSRVDVRVLDLELRERNFENFLRQENLLESFRQQFNY